MAKNELLSWVKNLQLCNGRTGSTTTGTGPYSEKCIEKRLGGCTSRDQNRGSVVQGGTGSTYQSAGTFSHKVYHLDTCYMWKMSAIHIQVDNMTTLCYLLKMGGQRIQN